MNNSYNNSYLNTILILNIETHIMFKNTSKCLVFSQGAEFHEIGPQLGELVDKSSNNKIDYIAIRGIVKPLGKPLNSINNKKLTGVVQKLKIKEHVVARTTAGFW